MQLILSHRYRISSLKIISCLGIIFIFVLLYIKFEQQKHTHTPLNTGSITSNLEVSNKNYEIILENSIFQGVNKYLEPYEITANSAIKTSDNKYNLNKVSAKYPMNNKNYLSIVSTYGTIYDDNKLIKLSDNVQIFFANLILNSENLEINLITKETASESEVGLLYKSSKITADSFISKDNSNIIIFSGHVMTKINLLDFNNDLPQ